MPFIAENSSSDFSPGLHTGQLQRRRPGRSSRGQSFFSLDEFVRVGIYLLV